MPSFVITAPHETDRLSNLRLLRQQLPDLVFVDAVYPSRQHVPFLTQLQKLSLERTGWKLQEGEIGVLLSNRKIWRHILHHAPNDDTLYLVLESDSVIQDLTMLHTLYPTVQGTYDLFFWGAWSGHMQLERSTKRKLHQGYSYGKPYIKTVYGAYGYSINRKAAAHLLQETAKISHPVDQYKYFIKENDLRVGGVLPEVITHLDLKSTIEHPEIAAWRRKAWLQLLDIKNAVICFFR